MDLKAGFGLVLAFLSVSRCGGDEAAAPSVEVSLSMTDDARRPATADDPRSPSTHREAQDSFLDRLPQQTVLVLRAPDRGTLREAWSQTVLWRTLVDGGIDRELVGMLQDRLRPFSGPAADLLEPDRWPRGLGGEAMLAILAVHPDALSSERSLLPVSAALMLRLDGSRPPVLEWLQRWRVEHGGTQDFGVLQEGSFRGRVDRPGCRVEVELDGEVLTLSFAPPGSAVGGIDRLTRRPPDRSFRACRLLRSQPPVEASEDAGSVEMMVNCTPLWAMLLALAPEEVQRDYHRLQLARVHGLVARWSPRGGLVDERWQVRAPDLADVPRRALGLDVDPSFVRWIPDAAALSGLLAVDWAVLFEEAPQCAARLGPLLCRLLSLPAPRETGSLPWRSWGSPLAFAVSQNGPGSGMQCSLALELEDPRAWQEWWLSHVGTGAGEARTGVVRGSTWAAGSSRAALERSLIAAEADGKLAPAGLGALLAREGGGVAGVVRADLSRLRFPGAEALERRWPQLRSRWGEVAAVLHREDFGLELRSRSIPGLAAPLALAAAAREPSDPGPSGGETDPVEAQEAAVVAVLQEIVRAQREIKTLAVVDADGDGEGEYASLAELAGAHGVRGRSGMLSPPLVDPALLPVEEGCGRRHGYLFRMFLPDRDGRLHPEDADGGTPRRADPDGAEWGWLVYAWPESSVPGGGRAFVVDDRGAVFVSDNEGARGRYLGLGTTPEADAAYAHSDLRRRGDRSVRRGRDGSIWLRHRP